MIVRKMVCAPSAVSPVAMATVPLILAAAVFGMVVGAAVAAVVVPAMVEAVIPAVVRAVTGA